MRVTLDPKAAGIAGGCCALFASATLVWATLDLWDVNGPILLEFKDDPEGSWYSDPPSGQKATAQIRHKSPAETIGSWWAIEAYLVCPTSSIPGVFVEPPVTDVSTIWSGGAYDYSEYPTQLYLPEGYWSDFHTKVTSPSSDPNNVYKYCNPTLMPWNGEAPQPELDLRYDRFSAAEKTRWSKVLAPGPAGDEDSVINFMALAKECAIRQYTDMPEGWFGELGGEWQEMKDGDKPAWVVMQSFLVRDALCDHTDYDQFDNPDNGQDPQGLISWVPATSLEPMNGLSPPTYYYLSNSTMQDRGQAPFQYYEYPDATRASMSGEAEYELQGAKPGCLAVFMPDAGGPLKYAPIEEIKVNTVKTTSPVVGLATIIGHKNPGEPIEWFSGSNMWVAVYRGI